MCELEEAAGIHLDLACRQQLDVRAVHRPRRGTFEVHAFAVISAAVARALEFILARLPVGRAPQVSTAREDREDAFRVAHDPNTVRLLKPRIYAETKIGRITDNEYGFGFKKCAGKKEAEEHEEVDAEDADNGTDYQFSANLQDIV